MSSSSFDMSPKEESFKHSSQRKGLPLMPNIAFPTMGGKVFWTNLAESYGWRVQKNKITGLCRLLDDKNYRRAWGGEEAIMNFFREIMEQ